MRETKTEGKTYKQSSKEKLLQKITLKFPCTEAMTKAYRPNAHPKTRSIEMVQSLPHAQARLVEHSH